MEQAKEVQNETPTHQKGLATAEGGALAEGRLIHSGTQKAIRDLSKKIRSHCENLLLRSFGHN